MPPLRVKIRALISPKHRRLAPDSVRVRLLRGHETTLVARCSGGRGSGADTPERSWDS